MIVISICDNLQIEEISMSFYFAGRYFDKYRPFFPYDYKDYSFKLDLRAGELNFTRKLILLPGKHLPLDLSLRYIHRHAYNTYDDLYLSTGFPRGFKTNFHVFLEYDSTHNKYHFEDEDGFLHKFKRSLNYSYIYYDEFGSGLMLRVLNNGFEIFDDDDNYRHFDQNGRLTTIHKKITSSHYAEIQVYYINNSSLKIDHITDNYGRCVYFTYIANQRIEITFNNNTVVTLYHDSEYLLYKVAKNIGAYIVEDLFETSCGFLTNITLASGESFTVSYTDDQIDGITTNINQDVFHFDYDPSSDTWTTVTNARGVSTRYFFTGNQSVSQTSDEYNNNLSFFKINSDISSCMIKTTSESDEITDFFFNNQSSINTNSYSTGYSDFALNNNLQAKKMYLLVVEIDGNLASDSFQIQLLDYDNNFLAELLFKGHETILSFPVGIKASTQKQFRLKYKNNCPNHIGIVKARLVPLLGEFELLCTNVDTGGPVFFYGNEPHYALKNGILYSVDNSIVNNLNLPVTYNDYIRNEKLFYKMGSYFFFWCDDFQRLVENISLSIVILPNDKYISFDSSRGEISILDEDFTYEGKVEFYRVKGKDDNSLSITKISHDSSSFHTGYTSFYCEEEETKYVAGNNGYTTYFDYNQYHNLVELNRSDGYKEEYVYDANGNLLSKAISHANITEQIKYEYSYDANDNLISEDKLVGSSVEQATFYYNNLHSLSKIEYPNSSFENYAYDSITAERETTVAFGHNNSSDFSQYIIAIDSNHSSYLTEDNNYYFSYSNGRLISVSYNNQQIFTITYSEEICYGVVISNGSTITYSNGGYIETLYDSFGRLSVSNNCLYHYDLCSNISAITDAYYSATYTSIIYTHDYYNQPIIVDHRYNHLTNNYEYDIYRRLISQSFLYNDATIYTVDYTYYSRPSLENAIKESTITYGSINISHVDDVDDISRLDSQNTFLNGNIMLEQSVSYCVGGPNDSLTSNMIKCVSFKAWTTPLTGPIQIPFISELFDDYYSYDSVGNITAITRKTFNTIVHQIDYVYDYHSRLVRENNPLLNKSFEYTYDDEGNITSKKEYAYSTNSQLINPDVIHSYSYDSTYPNRLTSFDNESIVYNSVGNPVTYRGKTMTWIKGTLLSQVVDGSNFINFTYDGLKQRIRKTLSFGSYDTTYDYNNNLLIRENRGTKTITYIYSHKGVIGFILDGFYDTSGATPVSIDGLYLYEKNTQQDVVAIRNVDHVVVARYAYDAWGNHQVLNRNNTINTNLTSVGHINPIRYRSYYFDTDLNMYWLTTRYYDPEIGRFISPDDYSYLDYRKLHGVNLYAYCKNNPVMFADPSGHFWWIILAAVVAVVAIVHSAVKLVQAAHEAVAASTEKTTFTEEEQEEKHYERGDTGGFYFYYTKETDSDGNKTKIQIIDSWKFTKAEVLMILNCLKYEKGCSNLNIARVYNEWQWHNVAHTLGYKEAQTGSVNFYLNARDDEHNPLVGLIFDFWWLG